MWPPCLWLKETQQTQSTKTPVLAHSIIYIVVSQCRAFTFDQTLWMKWKQAVPWCKFSPCKDVYSDTIRLPPAINLQAEAATVPDTNRFITDIDALWSALITVGGCMWISMRACLNDSVHHCMCFKSVCIVVAWQHTSRCCYKNRQIGKNA